MAKMVKKTHQTSVKLTKNGQDTASNHELEDHNKVYKLQHLALKTIITCNTRFSSV